jgi:hypothetical protein
MDFQSSDNKEDAPRYVPIQPAPTSQALTVVSHPGAIVIPSSSTAVLGGNAFESILDQIAATQDPYLRMEQWDSLVGDVERISAMVGIAQEALWSRLRNDDAAWKTRFMTVEELESHHAALKADAENSMKKRNYSKEAQKHMLALGNDGDNWERILPPVPSSTLYRSATQCASALTAARIDIPTAIKALNHQAMLRNTAGTRGGAANKGVSTTDYDKIKKMFLDDKTAAKMTKLEREHMWLGQIREIKASPEYSDEEIKEYGLLRTESGILYSSKSSIAGMIAASLASQPLTPAPLPAINQSEPQALVPSRSGPKIDELEATAHKRHASRSPQDSSSPLSPVPEDFADDNTALNTPAGSTYARKRINYGDENADEASSEESDDSSPFAPSAKKHSSIDAEGETQPGREDDTCKCGHDVNEAFKRLVQNQRGALKGAFKQGELAGQFQAVIDDGKFICYKHTKATATGTGLTTRHDHTTLLERLESVALHRYNLGTLKTADETFHWFARTVRPLHPSEIRGVYKYDFIKPPEFQPSVEHIIADINARYSIDLLDSWDETGNAQLAIFGWWFTETVGTFEGKTVTIGDLALTEFDVYMWHFRRESGNSGSLGWLRNAYYMGIQQMMRSDPEYYRLYVALRPDHNWRLISYPYYAKYAVDGDKTFFRHIDMNLWKYLLTGLGHLTIQGSVTLTDENDKMCTEILAGMHKEGAAKQWHARIAARNPGDKTVMNSHVNRVQDPKIWSKEDAEFFETDFKPSPCNAGDIRITDPRLPHGSTSHPPGGVRKTMLPWFVGIQPDHSTMEIPEMGVWEEIAHAHRSLTAAPRSPSGKPNIYGGIPYRFPASTVLRFPFQLSAALNGQTRWDMADVEDERNIVLGSDINAYHAYLSEWRKVMGSAYFRHFLQTKKMEEKHFGIKSFWLNGGSLSIPAPPADMEMTEEIRTEIDERYRSRGFAPEVHGQEGAEPGTVEGAPSEEELRSSADVEMGDA